MSVDAAPAGLTAEFAEAMSRLVSGLAVVTARRPDGEPCGLLVSSLCSYSAKPPSVLTAIDQAARSYPALVTSERFGVHLLDDGQAGVAGVFAGRAERKFDGLDWGWDCAVPRLWKAPVFLLCATATVLHHGDHAAVIGTVVRCQSRPGQPLVYYRRRRDWEIRLPGTGRG